MKVFIKTAYILYNKKNHLWANKLVFYVFIKKIYTIYTNIQENIF